jgi:hypothetical protein
MVRKRLHENEIFLLLYRADLCAIGAAIIIGVAVVVWLVSFYPGADRVSTGRSNFSHVSRMASEDLPRRDLKIRRKQAVYRHLSPRSA